MTTTDTSEAPERIAKPVGDHMDGSGTQEVVEYIRADIHQSELDAAYARGLREAAGRHRAMIAELNFDALRALMADEFKLSKILVEVAKLYEATEQAILALIPQPEEDG